MRDKWRISLTTIAFMGCAFSDVSAATIRLSDTDFIQTPVFSSVVTYDLEIHLAKVLEPGLVSDPIINNIQYSVSGNLTAGTISGFESFAFRLDHIFENSPPITGTEFYALNESSPPGGTLQFLISESADLSDGLQISELDELPEDPNAEIGPGVVFHFNARERGTGRYHPLFLQLLSDGTGLLQNSNNQEGVNPATQEIVDVDFGEEYITELRFDASTLTLIGPPQPIIPAPAIKASDQPNQFEILYAGEEDFSYQLQRSSDLSIWINSGDSVSGTSSSEIRFTADAPGFFRISRSEEPSLPQAATLDSEK